MPKELAPLARIGVVVAIAAASLSCSWLTDFVVVNDTDAALWVTYQVKDVGMLTEAEPYQRLEWPPLIQAVTVLREVELRGESARADAEVDEQSGVVRVRVPPGHALLVAQLASYHRPDLRSWSDFPISSITLEGEEGTLRYCGPGLLLTFDGGRELQSLVFTGTPRQLGSGFCDQG